MSVFIGVIKKNRWSTLSNREKRIYADDVFNLIDRAYSDIGGNPNYRNPSDVYLSQGDALYSVNDLDDDPDIDAVSVFKKTPYGRKSVASGQDGSQRAKREVLSYQSKILRRLPNYGEVSGRLMEILIAKGVPVVTDPRVIRSVLKGKRIKMHPDGSYSREIGGKMYRKVMVGKPMIM
jgi:hypothetical protein